MDFPQTKRESATLQRVRAESVIDLIGNTPLIRLSKIAEGISTKVEIYAKA